MACLRLKPASDAPLPQGLPAKIIRLHKSGRRVKAHISMKPDNFRRLFPELAEGRCAFSGAWSSVRISFAKSGFWPKAALRHGYPPTNVAAWRGDTNAPLRVVRKLFPASAGACFSAQLLSAPVACGARSGTTSPASHRKSDASTTPSACQPPGATDPPPRSVENVLGQPACVFWWARASDCVEHFF